MTIAKFTWNLFVAIWLVTRYICLFFGLKIFFLLFFHFQIFWHFQSRKEKNNWIIYSINSSKCLVIFLNINLLIFFIRGNAICFLLNFKFKINLCCYMALEHDVKFRLFNVFLCKNSIVYFKDIKQLKFL